VTFRWRLTLVAAAAVALAVLLASAIVYVLVRDQLRGQVDDSLRTREFEIAGPGSPPLHLEQFPDGKTYLDVHRNVLGSGGFVQLVSAGGKTYGTFDERGDRLPVSDETLDVARGNRHGFMTDARVRGRDVRVQSVPVSDPGGQTYALQVAQDLSGVNHTLRRIRDILFAICAGGIAFAAALGLVVSRAALAPVRRLTGATEKVAETGDLSERIDVHGTDELSRLAGRFNTMLGAL